MYSCMLCKKLITDKPLMAKKNNVWMISGIHAFHYYDTHGIPTEIFEEKINHLLRFLREICDDDNQYTIEEFIVVWGEVA